VSNGTYFWTLQETEVYNSHHVEFPIQYLNNESWIRVTDYDCAVSILSTHIDKLGASVQWRIHKQIRRGGGVPEIVVMKNISTLLIQLYFTPP